MSGWSAEVRARLAALVRARNADPAFQAARAAANRCPVRRAAHSARMRAHHARRLGLRPDQMEAYREARGWGCPVPLALAHARKVMP